MRNAVAIFALCTAACAAGCTSSGVFRVPRDAEPTSDAVQATGDTSVTQRYSADALELRPHGCVGPMPVTGPGLNPCPNGPRR
jgi:hypothetical protein